MMTTTNLWKALLLAQSEMSGAKRDSTNPHFKSTYADLESVQKACFPQLHKHGIVVIQTPKRDDSGPVLETVLIHAESGESVSNVVPVLTVKPDAQGYGSGLTYARRYGLMAICGLAPTDDDGTAACEPPKVGEKAPEKHAFLAPPKTKNDLIDRVTAMAQLMSCFLDEDHFLQFVETRAGRRLKEMTKPQLSGLISWLEAHQSFKDWDEQAVQQLRDAERAIGV